MAPDGLPGCAIDEREFTLTDHVVACDTCRVTVHEDCWAQRRKCPTAACRGRPLQAVMLERVIELQAPPSELGAETKDHLQEMEQRLERSITRVQKTLFDTLTLLRNQVTTALAEQTQRHERLTARMTEVFQRIRMLDFAVSRRHADGRLPGDAVRAPAERSDAAPRARGN